MNLYRLLSATMAVFPKRDQESAEDYGHRVLLEAAQTIRTWQLFEQHGPERVGSDLKHGEILSLYRRLTQEMEDTLP